MGKASFFSSIRAWGALSAWLALAASGLGLRAQEVWTSASVPTTQDLWGVCHGAGRFVAVGKGGTILTSPDGQAWTARTSGTTEWLTAVTYGAGKYVAVGGAGTILISSDAVSWRRAYAATEQRLNAIVYELGTFQAVGEQHSQLQSEDGEAWFVLGSRGRSNWLRGLAYAQDGFVMAGERGYFLRTPSRREGGPIVSLELGGSLEGVAGGAGTIVMVGADGAIWRWPDPQTARPQWVSSGVTTDLGAVIFADTVFVAGGGNGVILMSRDGLTWQSRPTPTTQALRALAASDRAFIAVGLGGAIVRSDFAPTPPTIVMQSRPVVLERVGSSAILEVHASGSAPLSYQWLRDGVPVSGATESRLALTALPAAELGTRYTVRVSNALGSVVSAGTLLQVTATELPSGQVDRSFVPQVPGPVSVIAPLADGRVVIAGNFSYVKEGGAQQGIARLTAVGEFDPSFDVGAGIPGNAVRSLAVQPDGKVLVGGSFAQVRGESRTRLVRLNADGTLDSGFAPDASVQAPTQINLLADGRILVADASDVLRWLRPDGSVAQTTTTLGSTMMVAPRLTRFDVRPDGGVVAAGTFSSVESYAVSVVYRPDGSVESGGGTPLMESPFPVAVRVMTNGDVLLARQGSAGSRLSTQGPITLSRSSAAYLAAPRMDNVGFGGGAAWLYPDGRAVLAGTVSSSDMPVPTGPVRNSLLRFNPDGTVDENFLRGPGVDGNIYAMAGTPDGRLYVGGAFTSVAGVTQPRLARLHSGAISPTAPRAIVPGRRYLEVRAGEAIHLRAQVAGTGPLALRWQHESETGFMLNPLFGGSTTTELTETARSANWSGYYSLTVSGPGGTAVSNRVYVKVTASKPPVVTQPPISQRARAGRGFVLTVGLEDATDTTYQWYRDGVLLLNRTTNSLTRVDVSSVDAGFYEVVVRNGLGEQRVGAMIEVVVAPTLVNVATRAPVASDSQTLIVGFVLAGAPGAGSRSTIIRGVGPGLAPFGVQGAVSDPRVAVFDSTGRQVAANDNWQDQAGATGVISDKGFPLAQRDAGVHFFASDGAHTVQVNGVGAAQGVALAEFYEDDSSRIGRIVNLSSRAVVGTGENVLIPGFVLQGAGRAWFLIRGIGPTLASFGVQGTLANPTLRIVDREGRELAINDDWGASSNASLLAQAAARSGAFALPTDSRDAAILIELPAGSYTAQLSGLGGTTGVGLVEVYEVP